MASRTGARTSEAALEVSLHELSAGGAWRSQGAPSRVPPQGDPSSG
jgi:hypothetical protein